MLFNHKNKGDEMISQQCQTTDSTIAFFTIFQRAWRYLKHLYERYGEWHEMQRQFSELLRKDDRMLKDIGLSRADVIRITQGQNFWEHMSQPEDCKNRCNGDGND